MTAPRDPLREALEEIAKGEGEFSRDSLKHAENTIESMKRIARDTLANHPSPAEAGLRETLAEPQDRMLRPCRVCGFDHLVDDACPEPPTRPVDAT